MLRFPSPLLRLMWIKVSAEHRAGIWCHSLCGVNSDFLSQDIRLSTFGLKSGVFGRRVSGYRGMVSDLCFYIPNSATSDGTAGSTSWSLGLRTTHFTATPYCTVHILSLLIDSLTVIAQSRRLTRLKYGLGIEVLPIIYWGQSLQRIQHATFPIARYQTQIWEVPTNNAFRNRELWRYRWSNVIRYWNCYSCRWLRQ